MAILPADGLAELGFASGRDAGEEAGDGAKLGATAGAATGIAVAASCAGPWAPLCFLVYPPLLAVMGGAAGGIGGVIYGYSGVSDTDALYLNEALAFLDQERDLQSALVTEVESAMPVDALAPPESASAQVLVRLVRIDFKQASRDRINMAAVAEMTVAMNGTEGYRATTREFDVESGKRNIDVLLAGDSSELEAAIDGFVVDLSAQISRELIQLTKGGP